MQNGTMIQFFHWYFPKEGNLWKHVKEESGRLAEMGINSIWLPPASKGANGEWSEGYDLYDMYDLGEFDQKGSVRTKYGTLQEYLEAVEAIHNAGMQLYSDVVTNHLSGADETETFMVRKVDPENRNEFISEPFEIEAYTRFTFPGRKGKYSDFIWDHHCFTGVDFDSRNQETGIYSIINEYGEGWEEMVDDEKGNFDYLLGADIEFRNPKVREVFRHWGEWYWNLIKFDGVRLDAVKHISVDFINEWLQQMEAITGKPLFVVGEFWAPDKPDLMIHFTDLTHGKMSLFDAPLHHNFFKAAKQKRDFDLQQIFDNSLVASRPHLAVTVVENHDTQPLQSLEAPIEPWFKPLGYALILLRKDGYPCIFYPDLYGASYIDKNGEGEDCEIIISKVDCLEKMIKARDVFAYGEQNEYLDFSNCIGWTREGDADHPSSGCAVVISNGDEGSKHMKMGKQHAGKTFIDFLGNHQASVEIDAEGFGDFFCPPESVSVWVVKE